MTEKDQKFVDTWKIALALGRKKASLKYGFIFGLFTYIFSSLILRFAFGEENVFNFNRILIQLPVFILVGVGLFYYFNWPRNTKKYNQLTNNN